jgi:DNA-directed RNA polymerase specialized sigma24 family protein
MLRAACDLDPASLELLSARYFEDEPLRAIARRHRITPSAAKTRVHRARLSLRRLLEAAPASRPPRLDPFRPVGAAPTRGRAEG